jgi:hypothetical protein
MPVRRAIVIAVLATTVFAPAARADGGGASPGVLQGSPGIVDAADNARFVALWAGGNTLVAKIKLDGGVVERTRLMRGSYGLPLVTWNSDVAGLSANRRLLVLASQRTGQTVLRPVSRFVVFRAQRLAKPTLISLRGDFSFDALSPDGTRLYLTQHTSAQDLQRYLVRAYDLVHRRLLPDPIVDRTEPNMRGIPYARLATRDGSWVYTLYHGGHEPFVHALDTVHGRAVCLDIEWSKKDGALWRMKLRFVDGGRRLGFVDRASGKSAKRTLALNRPRASGSGTGWSALAAFVAALAAAGLFWRQRRRD